MFRFVRAKVNDFCDAGKEKHLKANRCFPIFDRDFASISIFITIFAA
jgi:hypothetical protein